MKLNDLFENKKEVKDRNPIAKELRSNPQFKAKTELDKKKREKQGYQKHKGKVEEASSMGMNKYGLAAKNVGGKFYSYKDGVETGVFDSMEELKKHQEQILQQMDKKHNQESVEEGHSNTRQQAQTMLKLEELRDMIMVLDMDDDDKTSALTALDQVADDITITEEEYDRQRDADAVSGKPRKSYFGGGRTKPEGYSKDKAEKSAIDNIKQMLAKQSTTEEATIKPYVSMYRDEKNKMVYDVLDKHGKSAFKSHDEKEAMKYFKDNYKKMRNESSGYEGQVEPHMHVFKTMDFDQIKQIIDDKKLRAYAEKRPDGSVAVHTMNPSRAELVKAMGVSETIEEGIFGKEATKVKQSDPLKVIGNLAMRKDNKPFPIKTRDGEIEVRPTQAQQFINKFYRSSDYTRNEILDKLKTMATAKKVFEDEATSQRYAAAWRKEHPIGSNWLNPDDYDADAEGTHMITNTRTEMDIFMVPAKNYDEAFDKWLDGGSSSNPKDNIYYDSTKDYASDHSYWGRKAPEQDDDDLEDSVQFEEDESFSDKHIKQAFGILNDPRYKQGNYDGAVDVINKIAPGLADHPSVKNALMRANEGVSESDIMDPQTKKMIPEKDYVKKYVMSKHPEATKKLLQSEDLMDIYDTELYMDLFDYFSEEMPYGTQKARDGDPVEYMQDKLDMMGMFESEVNNLLNRSNRNRDLEIARLTQLAGLTPKDVQMEDYSKMTKELITKLVNDGMSDEEIQSRTGETSKRIEIIRKHVEDEATEKAQMAYKLARDEGETAEATQDLARQLNPMKSAVDTNQSPAVTAKGLDAISKGERPTPNQIKAVEPYVSKLAKAISNPQTAAQMRNVFKKVQ